ncbi:GIY-YIG nuclease family protein [Desulfocurvus sp. DL9XJH121]
MTVPCEHPWHVYLLRCADGTLYCGVTTDLSRRVDEHNAGTGAKYTRARRPVHLVASAGFPDRSAAQSAEYAVKQRPSKQKIIFLDMLAKASHEKSKKQDP